MKLVRRLFIVQVVLLSGLLLTGKAQAQDRSLRVMTYNVHGIPCFSKIANFFGLPRCLVNNNLSKNIDDRLKQLARELNRMNQRGEAPDVLLIQEAFRSHKLSGVILDMQPLDRLERELRSIYPYMIEGPEATRSLSIFDIGKKPDGILSSGLLVFSKYPARKLAEVSFGKLSDGDDRVANKGAILVEVSTPYGLVDVLNTHLQARSIKSSWSEERKQREREKQDNIRWRQIQRLRPLVNQNGSANVTILGGDFNFKNHRLHPNFDQFLDYFGRFRHMGQLCDEDRRCRVTSSTPRGVVRGNNNDHLFSRVRGGADLMPQRFEMSQFYVGQGRGKPVSDHDYILMDLWLR